MNSRDIRVAVENLSRHDEAVRDAEARVAELESELSAAHRRMVEASGERSRHHERLARALLGGGEGSATVVVDDVCLHAFVSGGQPTGLHVFKVRHL